MKIKEMQLSVIHNKIELCKRILKKILILFFVFIGLTVFYNVYEYGPYSSKEYRAALNTILKKELIGLDFDECCEKLGAPKNTPKGIYAVLKEEHDTVHGNFKDIEYSYYARFYVCNAFTYDDDVTHPYCYMVYFDKEQRAVYAELIVDRRGG